MIKRQEEGWLALLTRFVIAIPLLMVLLLNIFYPQAMGWAKFNIPQWIKITGLVLGFLCIPFLWWVFSSIGKNISETVLVKDEHELVMHGPYSRIRHPLYAGALVLLISTSLVLADYVIMGYGVIGILAFRLLVIPAEEQQLLEAFGEDYECYQSRTNALMPWIR
jgi:protein-S-isoprenylcysteine O-methyltransferase Ste14